MLEAIIRATWKPCHFGPGGELVWFAAARNVTEAEAVIAALARL